MDMPINKGVVLASRPAVGGRAKLENFALVEQVPVPTPGPGGVLVRHHFLSSTRTCAAA